MTCYRIDLEEDEDGDDGGPSTEFCQCPGEFCEKSCGWVGRYSRDLCAVCDLAFEATVMSSPEVIIMRWLALCARWIRTSLREGFTRLVYPGFARLPFAFLRE